MRFPSAFFAFLGLGITAVASSPKQLGDFELTDQNAAARKYSFPKTKVTAMTVADQKGSDQLAPWIQRLYDRYGERIDIDGVADVSMIPKSFRGLVREVFRKRLTHSVMLDWDGSVVRRFGYERGLANIYVIDRRGCIVMRVAGPVNPTVEQELFQAIDRAIADRQGK